MKPVLVLLCGMQMWAQSLQLLPAPPSDKMARSVEIMIVSPSINQPTAIQWRISASGVILSGEGITSGSAAEKVQKFITCAASKDKNGVANSFFCILAGGTQPISNGPLAVVRFSLPATAASANIRVSDILGVTANAKPIRMADVETTMELSERHVVK